MGFLLEFCRCKNLLHTRVKEVFFAKASKDVTLGQRSNLLKVVSFKQILLDVSVLHVDVAVLISVTP